jgi:phosphoglycolate phosphatase
MALSKPEMVLIDLDGTLVNSVPDLAWCIDETMLAFNLPTHGEQKVQTWLGNGAKRLMERALSSNDKTDNIDHALFDRAFPHFLSLYAENLSKRSQLYPSVIEGLTWLQQEKIRIGCVTNKDEAFSIPVLTDLGIRDYFEIVISGDTLPVKKPDPAPLLHGAHFFNTTPDRSVMIGDSITDITAARNAGFSVICTSYGYNHGIDIATANPDAVIDSFAELTSIF